MHRLSILIVTFVLYCGNLPARTTQEPRDEGRRDGEEGRKVRARRVLFRTDPVRVVPPQPARKSPEKTAPVQKAVPVVKPAAKPAKTVRLSPAPAIPPSRRALEPRLRPAPASPSVAREIEFQPTSFTPYDAYLGTVRSVISRVDARAASMITACHLMREGRAFRYLASDPYRAQPPSETETRRAGNCKSKALWLYDHLGDPAAYYVIGKLERRSRTSHAWVYWRYGGRWWILDPTDRATPIAADSVSQGRYVPYYSYSKAGAFRHSATRMMLASGGGIPATPAVASGVSRR